MGDVVNLLDSSGNAVGTATRFSTWKVH